MKRNSKETRTALLIRCTEEEAQAIRETAKQQRRTVSAFVMGAVMNRVSIQRASGAVLRGERFLGPAPLAPDKLSIEKDQTSAVKTEQVTDRVSSKSC